MGTQLVKGTFTTIRWGTSNVLQSTLATGAIVISARVSKLGGEPIKLEGNEGFTAIVVMLDDGDRLEINVIDDTAKTWPVKGDVVSFKAPTHAAAANYLVVDNNASTARKAPGERTIIAEKYTDITLT